jgi:hypothetical protein
VPASNPAVTNRPASHAGERLLIRAQRFPQWIGDVRVSSGVVPGGPSAVRDLDDRQIPGVRDRQRPHTERVDQLEDCGVGADAQRQREDGDCREPGTPQEDAGAVAEILP